MPIHRFPDDLIAGGIDIDAIPMDDDGDNLDGLNGLVTASGLYGRVNADLVRPLRIDGSSHAQNVITYAHHEIHSGSHFYIDGYASLGVGGTLFVKLVTPNLTRWGHFIWEINSNGILTTTFDEDATGGMAGGAVVTIHANNRNTNCWTGRHTGPNNEATVLTDATKTWVVNELVGYQVFNTLDGSSGVIVSNTNNTATVVALAGGAGNDWDTADEYEINRSRFVVTSAVTACTDYIQRVSNISFGAKQTGGSNSRIDELILKQDTVYCRSFTSSTASNIVNFKASWYEHEDRD